MAKRIFIRIEAVSLAGIPSESRDESARRAP
jgi:hypothetical protein